MGLLEIILTALGLSMDALAVSVCKGLSMKKVKASNAFIIALFFGVFQAIMPLIGWFFAINFKSYIERFDHWIAFVLLAFIGGKMIYDCMFGKDDDQISECIIKLNYKELVALSVATSIDALVVGIAMAFVGDSLNFSLSIALIGIITFAVCFAGVYIGNKFGNKFEKNSQFAGGLILILIGTKIILEHLGIIDALFNAIS